MKLQGRDTTIYLTEEGRMFLNSAEAEGLSARTLGDGRWGIVMADVEETDELGIWLRFERERSLRFLLLRWGFVLGIEVNDKKNNVIGLKR